jgi:sugar lactone lactonase YvrE
MAATTIDGFAEVARGVYLEGLIFDHARDTIWYSDVIAGGVHGLSRHGDTTTLDAERMWTGGLLVTGDGAVLSSGVGGIRWNDPDTGRSGWLLNEIEGVAINGINEMVPDGAGGIVFGTLDLESILAGRPTRPSSLYRLTAAGEVIHLADDMGLANGIMLSADGRMLFCNSTFDGVYAFDIASDGSLQARRRVLEKPDCDGLALDAEGMLWVTGFRSSAITRIAPDGTVIETIATPADAITQVRFGGADMREVTITSVPAEGGDDLAEGKLPSERRSVLYRGRSNVPGLRIAPPQFSKLRG